MANSRAAMIDDRHDPEHVAVDEREHRPEHEHLVGQRIEERARPGRAVAAGEVAVDAVAARTTGTTDANADHDPPGSSGIITNMNGDDATAAPR